MNVLAGDISRLVLKRTVRADLGEVSLDSEMLQVLMELDGAKNLGQVSRALNMSLKQLRFVLNKLFKLNLCEAARDAIPTLDRDFFNYLSAELSRAMGPIADVVIEDEISDMGEDQSKFPAHRAAELVDMLARQILREERKVAFQQAMVKKLREIKT
jgi:AraC-like DNA-binding protein